MKDILITAHLILVITNRNIVFISRETGNKLIEEDYMTQVANANEFEV